MKQFPFGDCECRDGCQCQNKPGPAAFIVKRGDAYIKCCTRCDLSDDVKVKLLIPKSFSAKDFMEIYFDYDPLSIISIPKMSCAVEDEIEN